MNRIKSIQDIRKTLKAGGHSIGSWMQIPHPSVAEIMGNAEFDWVAVDMEHGAISVSQLPDLFRALELGKTLPLARIAHGQPKECKQALDSGAGGIIVPMVETAEQLIMIRDSCRWPPSGTRGVGFSRANLFGQRFDNYSVEAQTPLLIAMIEHHRAINNLHDLLAVDGLDAIMVGPYDLSASMGLTAQFDSPKFKSTIKHIKDICTEHHIPCGIHLVSPDNSSLHKSIHDGYQFIAYSIDAVFLNYAILFEKT